MNFNVEASIKLLERTPSVLYGLLNNLSDEWIFLNEGVNSWSPYDVMVHLIHGEKTDWIPRMEIILSAQENKQFTPFDRMPETDITNKPGLNQLLDLFKQLRESNLDMLKKRKLTDQDLIKTGVHPAFGEVTLAQLLSTWVVHDLNHLAQISSVMASQYKDAVGPWVQYLGILNSRYKAKSNSTMIC